jgi:ATP-dependent RNA helicase DHX8/PRP22
MRQNVDPKLEPNLMKRKDSLSSSSASRSSSEKPAAKRDKSKKEDKKSSKKLKRKRSYSTSSSKSTRRSRSKSKRKTREGGKKRRDRSSRSSSSTLSASRRRGRQTSRRSRSGDRRRSKDDQRAPEVGRIYDGYVTMKLKDGFLVQLSQWKSRTEGLVHLNGLESRGFINALEEVKLKQRVKVRVVNIEGRKMFLSMKDIDQRSGEDLKAKRKADIEKQLENAIFTDATMGDGRTHGSLTGIKLTDEVVDNKRAQDRLNSPDLWEASRMKYFAGKDIGPMKKIEDMDEKELNEEDVEIELNDKEPAFLVGQTSKTGVNLSPIRVVINPEGSLQMEAIKGLQYAKERRENREQKQRAMLEGGDGEKVNDFLRVQGKESNADYRNDHFNQYQIHKEPDVPEELTKNAYPLMPKSKIQKKSRREIQDQRESLPIFQYKEELLAAIRDNKILIVIGETGSGKTTQMTQYLLEAGFGGVNKKIGCTQPRRIAARSVAKRVADEMGVKLGQEVGYSIRFEDCTSPQTMIKYMTDGMLLREALLDKDLEGYGALMLDEAHERTIHTDVLFGLLKETVTRRDDLKLIVTSATLDAAKFSSYFYNCKIFRIPGRSFPVKVFFTKEPEIDYLEASLACVMQIHLSEPAGDILMFLTGQEEIDTACQILNERMSKLGNDAPLLIVLPVYSALPTEKQTKIFEPAPPGARKCVIATNIAEASLTIDGIYYVVDPGFAKIKCYNPKLGMDSLVVAPISQASADQRAGRAGRTGPGKCFRLYTEEAFRNEMMPVTVPEIQRTNLANTVLLLKAMGINDLINFDFMDPPPVQTLIAALESLYALGALNEEGLLTKLGRKMAEFPLEPQLSKMLLTSVDLICSDDIITIVAMLTVQNVFYRPKDKQTIADKMRSKFYQPEGDHLTLLTVYEIWKANQKSDHWCHDNFIHARAMKRAHDVRKQLLTIMERYKLPILCANGDFSKIRKAICAGFFAHAARRDPKEGYKTLVEGQSVFIHPSSALFNKNPEWVIYHELVLTSKEYMREVCAIEPKWLVDVAPNFFRFSDPTMISHRKKEEKLEPLHLKYNSDPNAWRLNRRRCF